MMGDPFKYIQKFDWSDLHRKVGQLAVIRPTDSDLQEGQFNTQVWFMTEEMNCYLLAEFPARLEDEMKKRKKAPSAREIAEKVWDRIHRSMDQHKWDRVYCMEKAILADRRARRKK